MTDYTSTLVNELCSRLDRAVGLPFHRFAGYVANLEFWIDEFAHCMLLIQNYDVRFERMRKAVKSYAAGNVSKSTMGDEGEYEAHAVVPNPPVRKSLNAQELWELSDSLNASIRRFVQRALRDSLTNKAFISSIAKRNELSARILELADEAE